MKEIIASSFPVLFILNTVTTSFKLCGCFLAVLSLFGGKTNKILTAVLFLLYSVCFGFISAQSVNDGGYGIAAAVLQLCFFVLVPAVFAFKNFGRVLAISFCYDMISGAFRYILLMLLGFDWLDPGASDDIITQVCIDLVLFAGFLLLYILYTRKMGALFSDFSGNGAMYVLITVTLAYFIMTMVILGENNSAERRGEFIVSLLNIPLFTFTIGYAVKTVIQSKLAEDNYKKILDMQVKNYETLERKNDEVRIFRHDFPKKMRPLLMYAEQGNTEEVRNIVNGFNTFIEASRPRYTTGNYRLDTVLECERQTAVKYGIDIEFAVGSVFPADGIDADDIYTIFPNVLDNAVESASRLGEPSTVRVASRIIGDTVYICISNRFDGKLNKSADGLKTVKADRSMHGYGLRSIKKAASKYGSDNVRHEVNGDVFSLFIDLKMK